MTAQIKTLQIVEMDKKEQAEKKMFPLKSTKTKTWLPKGNWKYNKPISVIIKQLMVKIWLFLNLDRLIIAERHQKTAVLQLASQIKQNQISQEHV